MEKLNKRKLLCQQAIESNGPNATVHDKTPEAAFTNTPLHGFCDGVSVFLEESAKHRGVIATKPLKTNQVISCQQPYVSVLSPEHYITRCYHCLKPLAEERPFPCRKCSQVSFCNLECSEKAWSAYHSYECTYLEFLSFCDNFYYPPKIAFKAILSTPRSILLKAKERSASSNTVYHEANYEGVYSLLDHSEHCPDYSLPTALLASFLCEIKFLDDSNSQELEFYAGLLLKHIQQCQVNGIKIMGSGKEGDYEVGVGIYQTFSLLNHSCRPNVAVNEFDGHKMVLAMAQDAAPGKELCVSYGVDCFANSTKARQSYLENTYFFHCLCEACKNLVEPSLLN